MLQNQVRDIIIDLKQQNALNWERRNNSDDQSYKVYEHNIRIILFTRFKRSQNKNRYGEQDQSNKPKA